MPQPVFIWSLINCSVNVCASLSDRILLFLTKFFTVVWYWLGSCTPSDVFNLSTISDVFCAWVGGMATKQAVITNNIPNSCRFIFLLVLVRTCAKVQLCLHISQTFTDYLLQPLSASSYRTLWFRCIVRLALSMREKALISAYNGRSSERRVKLACTMPSRDRRRQSQPLPLDFQHGAMLCSARVLPFGLAFVLHDSDIFVQSTDVSRCSVRSAVPDSRCFPFFFPSVRRRRNTQAINEILSTSPCHCLVGFPLHPAIASSL